MDKKTQYSESSDTDHACTTAVRSRRVEDELRLRELELHTNFQIKTLSDSLDLLKTDFNSWRDSLNVRIQALSTEVYSLKTRLTVVIALLIGQMAGVPGSLSRLLGGL